MLPHQLLSPPVLDSSPELTCSPHMLPSDEYIRHSPLASHTLQSILNLTSVAHLIQLNGLIGHAHVCKYLLGRSTERTRRLAVHHHFVRLDLCAQRSGQSCIHLFVPHDQKYIING